MSRPGVLVLAHGSKEPRWVDQIDQAVAPLEGWTVAIGFLGQVKGRGVAEAVRRLEGAGVREMVAIPLFVSSGSTHLVELKYALGLVERPPFETELQPIRHGCKVKWLSALDDHPLVEQIVVERVQALSKACHRETVLLVAHGSDQQGFREKWHKMLENLSNRIRQHFGFIKVDFATVHPLTIRPKAEALAQLGTLLVVPLFLSPGYYTERYIPSQLEGLPAVYSGQTYLPHPLISRWLKEQITCLWPD